MVLSNDKDESIKNSELILRVAREYELESVKKPNYIHVKMI